MIVSISISIHISISISLRIFTYVVLGVLWAHDGDFGPGGDMRNTRSLSAAGQTGAEPTNGYPVFLFASLLTTCLKCEVLEGMLWHPWRTRYPLS